MAAPLQAGFGQMQKSLTLLLAIASALALPSQASAQDAVTSRPNTVGMNLGLFSAVGTVGVTYGRDVTPLLNLELGAGLGFSGLQMSAMPKLTLGKPNSRFVTGVGLAYATGDHGNTGLWANADVAGYEFKSVSGFSLLLAAGLTYAIDGQDECDADWGFCAYTIRGAVGPQGRVVVGYAF